MHPRRPKLTIRSTRFDIHFNLTDSRIMSFQPNFEGGAQQQQGKEEQNAFGAAPTGLQQPNPMNQQMDPSQQQGQFPGAPQGGAPGPGGPQAGGDQKTTLW
jgi:hypothetical protein